MPCALCYARPACVAAMLCYLRYAMLGQRREAVYALVYLPCCAHTAHIFGTVPCCVQHAFNCLYDADGRDADLTSVQCKCCAGHAPNDAEWYSMCRNAWRTFDRENACPRCSMPFM